MVVYLPVVDPSALMSLGAHVGLLDGLPVILYVGPDQILPVTSFIGGVIGFLLMFWHRLVDVTRKVRARVTRGNASSQTQSGV
jgi:hypothetical protein